MQSKVEKFIEEEKLLKKNSKVVLGVSGGADSIALLNVLHDAGYKVIVAHCNFHLREEESMRDESFVKNMCEERGLIYNSIDFDTIKHAAQYSLSIEMAARELRYSWFEELRQAHKAEAIAVAHHKDDSVETVLMNLIRGTGIKGLTGIETHVKHIIRPFLCVTRAEIEEYMKITGLGHVEDSTNTESIYTRNIVRLDIMPYMERINPSAKQSIYKTMTFLKQVENIYFTYISEAKKDVKSDDKIDIEKLKKTIEPEAVLFEVLSDYGFNSSVANDVFESLDEQSGKVFYSDSHKIVKDRDFLLIEPKKEEKKKLIYEINEVDLVIDAPIKLEIEKLEVDSNFNLLKSLNILSLDCDKISFPLILRRWQKGDWFVPIGMRGKKKISDFFTDNKFSLFDKEDTWLLCSGNDIVWIVGHRPDDRFKVIDSTKYVLQIRLKN